MARVAAKQTTKSAVKKAPARVTTKKEFMIRRGRSYQIVRKADGTIERFVPVVKAASKTKSTAKQAAKQVVTKKNTKKATATKKAAGVKVIGKATTSTNKRATARR